MTCPEVYTSRDLIEDENWKVMQFTGLTDRHGKEIYEGDIVKIGSDLGKINYSEKYSGFRVSKKGQGIYLSDFNSAGGCEVIGNIYENPKLIK